MSKRNAPVADVPVSLDNIEKLYDMDFRGPEERQMVEEFIRSNPEIIPLLEDAREVIRSHFPDGSPFLGMEGLQEGPENQYLVAYIRLKMKGKDAVVPGREIDNWLFLLPPELTKKFDIDTYFL